MGITLETPKSELDAFLLERARRVNVAVKRGFAVAGEKAINAARRYGSYTDRTGNLRSSTGYTLVEDGRILNQSAFKVVRKGAEGAEAGRDLADKLANDYTKAVSLIVVAGMSYAQYVQAKGYDVLDNAKIAAEKECENLKRDIQEAIDENG